MARDRAHFANQSALGYETVFYPARAFPATHPQRLATTLTLLGLRAPPVEGGRVLEIGCATGGNLLPMADSLPGARFVGIDSSPAQIEAASRNAQRLGLKNVEFRCQDLCDFHRPEPVAAAAGWSLRRSKPATPVPDGPEPFDYIIAHGVYSWVTPATREKLLSLCSRHLAPGGVAYISYNTLPGWNVQSAIRELMLAHIWESAGEAPTTARDVVAKGREVLDFLIAADVSKAPFAALLKETAGILRTMSDANLIHDHLGPINEPVYFSQFMAEGLSAGLKYVGDALPQAPVSVKVDLNLIAVDRPPPALSRIASDPADLELFLDIWSNRPFRQSLLCRADSPPAAISGSAPLLGAAILTPDARYVRGLHVGSSLKPTGTEEPEFGRAAPQAFITPGGVCATIVEPLTRSAIYCLADVWPARLPSDELLEVAWRRMGLAGGAPGADTGAQRLADALLQGHIAGVIELSVGPARCATRLSRRPAAWPVARVMAETEESVPTLRHENLQLNATARHLLRLLDGTRDFADLCTEMERIVLDNARNMDPTLSLSKGDREQIATALKSDLRKFVDEGLLVG